MMRCDAGTDANVFKLNFAHSAMDASTPAAVREEYCIEAY